MPVRIDALNPAVAADPDHQLPVMKTGISNKITVGQILALLVADAPANLNTLDKIAASLGDDPDFSTTMAAALAGNASAIAECIRFASAQTLTASQQAQARSNISAALRGHIHGLTLSNSSTDAANDIDIAAGEAASTEANPVLMVLPSGISKRLDAAWAVGTNQGGLDTGSVTSTTYHVWLIQRSDTGVVDVLFSASATSPTMPTNYDRKRRIGSILRKIGAIVQFRQVGDDFLLETASLDRDSTSAAATGLLTVSVPTSLVVQPYFRSAQVQGTAGNSSTQIATAGKTLDSGDAVALTGPAGSIASVHVPLRAYTNTAAQVQFAVVISGTLTANQLYTLGWRDRRGKDG